MIDKKTRIETEDKLRNYYESDRRIKSYKEKIEFLENQTSILLYKLDTGDIHIPLESKSPSFRERVQTSMDGSSYVERAMIQVMDRLEKEVADNIKEIERLEEEIRKIDKDNKIIDSNIKWLSERHRKYLELRYKKKWGNWQIANKLNISEATCTRMRDRLLENISKWEGSFLS